MLRTLAGVAFTATIVGSVALAAFTPVADTPPRGPETVARSCPSGQIFDPVSGECKTYFDIRGSFASTPLD
ncbi:MAG: hypothetical protein ACR2O4_05385 [Hyphomicrobiaceae bacterium]